MECEQMSSPFKEVFLGCLRNLPITYLVLSGFPVNQRMNVNEFKKMQNNNH